MRITFYGNSEKATNVTITSDKLLTIEECTTDLVKNVPFKTKIRGIGSWDTEESRRTLYGYAMYVNFDCESNGPYLARYKNEDIVAGLIKSIRGNKFDKNVTYKDGKQSKVEITYDLGNIGQLSRDETEEVLAEEAIAIEYVNGSRKWYLRTRSRR
jgi:hypothetical protein